MHYKSIQAGRAIAALIVVFFHLGATIALSKYFGQPLLGRAFSFGHAGVHFFFVLSGFIIMNVHMKDLFQSEKVKSFLIKRCVRIYPIYWLIFIAVFISALAVPSLRGAVPSDMPLILKALALLPLDKSVVGGTGAPVLIVAWSLQYELYFYGLFSLAILSRWLAVALAVVLAAGLMLGLGSGEFPASFIWSDWIVLFFLGVGVAVLVRIEKSNSINSVLAIGISSVLLVGLAAFEVIGKAGEVEGLRIFYGLGFSGLIFGFVCYEKSGRVLPLFLSNQFTQTLGNASYFLYLIHFPLISLLLKLVIAIDLSGFVGALIAFVVVALACVVVAVAGHLLIELPMQKWLMSRFTPKPTFAVVQ